MPTTPSQRSTRSGSNASNITLHDIKVLIESSKTEILTTLKNEVEKLNDVVSSLTVKVDLLAVKNAELENRCQKLEDQSRNISSIKDLRSETEDLLYEIEERQKRRKHLIVAGLPECSNGTLEERAAKDEETLRELSRGIGLENFDVEEVRRIGRISSSKPRLLRVKCYDNESKIAMLRKARSLRHLPQYSKVYINPDLTLFQREQNKQLRTELRRRREMGEKVTIRRGQIVDLTQEQHFR